MELKHLQYFLTLAEELHFARAATKLFIAQPPLSRQIQQLEKELGIKLFDRNNRSVKLTAAGEYLKQETAQLFEHLTVVKNHLALINQGILGQARIGYVGAVMYSFLPKMLGDFKLHYPKVNTILSEMGNDAQVAAIKGGQLDIGFTRGPISDESIKMLQLMSEPFVIVISASHSYANKATLSLQDLSEDPFISFSRDCAPSMVDNIIKVCNNAGFSPKRVHECSQINTIMRLVENNLGYSIIPASVQKGYSLNLRYYELGSIPEKAELIMIYSTTNNTPLMQNIINFVIDFCKNTELHK
ncbi:LysR family transcriptional regulator [Sporomusaceae bacterium FL31]|nr:LysR family transcriptional regulator [Sporomusaceae bacterium FL31]GCE35325.1 LysR family transcriptional regulator [Sporomusaceae bacterium]